MVLEIHREEVGSSGKIGQGVVAGDGDGLANGIATAAVLHVQADLVNPGIGIGVGGVGYR